MSAFNVVTLDRDEICPNCTNSIRRRVQFKYGDTWQYDYLIGDRIRWGGNDVGKRAHKVKVLGQPEDCPVCDFEGPGVYDVIICDDVIKQVTPGRTEPYISAGDKGYIVLEP